MSTSLGRLIVVVVVVVSRFEWWIRGATTSAKTARWRCARRTARGDRHARGLLYHRPSARPSSPNAAESLCVVHPHHARKARRGKASGGWMDTNFSSARRDSTRTASMSSLIHAFLFFFFHRGSQIVESLGFAQPRRRARAKETEVHPRRVRLDKNERLDGLGLHARRRSRVRFSLFSSRQGSQIVESLGFVQPHHTRVQQSKAMEAKR